VFHLVCRSRDPILSMTPSPNLCESFSLSTQPQSQGVGRAQLPTPPKVARPAGSPRSR
jgi:hypothetical protein